MLYRNSDLVMISPYALKVYMNTKNTKIRTGSPFPLPPKRVLGVEPPLSIVPYTMGNQICSLGNLFSINCSIYLSFSAKWLHWNINGIYFFESISEIRKLKM